VDVNKETRTGRVPYGALRGTQEARGLIYLSALPDFSVAAGAGVSGIEDAAAASVINLAINACIMSL
jgi:hypothetical protein